MNRIITLVFVLSAFVSNAQRTMFSSNNNYVAPPPGMVTTGLKLYLDAANLTSYPGSGSTWSDLSGNNNHATLYNGPTFNAGNGGSIYTDGTNDYAVSSYIGSPTDSLTYAAWFKNDNTFEPKFVLTRGRDGGGNTWSLFLHITTAGKAGASVVTLPSNNQSGVNGTSTLAINKWYYVTAVWKAGQSIKIYVNGVLEGTASVTESILRTSTSGFGIGSVNTSNFTSGYTAVVQVYNKALSNAEILQNYNAHRYRF